MKTPTSTFKFFLVGSLVFAAGASAEEEYKYREGAAIERSLFEESKYGLDKAISEGKAKEVGAFDFVHAYKNDLTQTQDKASKGILAAEDLAHLNNINLSLSILRELDEGILSSAMGHIAHKVKVNSESEESNILDAASSDMGMETLPFKLVLSAQGEGEDAAASTLSLVVDDEKLSKLKEENESLHKLLKDSSEEEQKEILENIVKLVNEQEGIFKDGVSAEARSKIAEDDDYRKKVVAKVSAAEKALTETISRLSGPKLSHAQSQVDRNLESADEIAVNMAAKVAMADYLKEVLEKDGIEGLKKLSACQVLAKSGIYQEELSAAEKKECLKDAEVAALFPKKEKKEDKSSHASADKKKKSKKKKKEEAELADTNAPSAEETAEQERKEAEQAEAANREKFSQAQMQNENFRRLQYISNVIVPMACNNQSLNSSLPFAGDPTNTKTLDNLEEGLAATMSACKTTGFVDVEIGNFGSSIPLLDGRMLAAEAMDEIFPRGAAQMTATDAKDLESERKCLIRSVQAMNRGLRLTQNEIARQSRDRAREKLFRMRSNNPAAYSQALMFKQMEMAQNNKLTAFTTEEDLTNELYKDYKAKFEVELADERKLLKKENDLKVVKALASDVSNLYSERVNYLANSSIRSSTNAIPVSNTSSSTGTRRAPSRATSSGGGSAGSLRQNQMRAPARTPSRMGQRTAI